MCSRREADLHITRGDVIVNGELMDVLGTRVESDAVIELKRGAEEPKVTILLNKPLGVVSSQAEHGHTPAVRLLRAGNRQGGGAALAGRHLRGLAVCGRLDVNSKGLLVLSQDGRLARRLLAPPPLSCCDKEYLVRVRGPLTPRRLRLLRHGLSLDGAPLMPAKVEQLNDDQVRVVLHQGKKRQIRRMLQLVDLQCLAIKRVRIGGVVLGNLRESHWRWLKPHEKF